MLMTRPDIKISHVLLALVCTYAVIADLSAFQSDMTGFDYYVSNLFLTRYDPVVPMLIAVPMYLFVRHVKATCFPMGPRNVPVTVLAWLFSLFTVVGTSYHIAGNGSLLHGVATGQMLKALFWFLSLVVLYYYLLAWLFLQLDLLRFSNYRSNPRLVFGLTFLILVLGYIPYAVASYPAIFLADEVNQILSAYPELGFIRPGYLEGHLIDEHVFLNEHHPIAHTLLMKAFLDLGVHFFHSANVGIFLLVLLQMLLVFSAISYLARTLSKYNLLSKPLYIAILGYFILTPRINNYMMLTAKDIIYAASLVYFLCFLFQMVQEERGGRSALLIGLILSSLGLYFFRNEGRYLLIFTFLMMFILEKGTFRKIAVSGVIFTITLTLVLSTVVYPAFAINKGSRREMLSVPFQQTARYVTEHGEEVSQHEQEVIDAVLGYDDLAERYQPHRSDNVKNGFREDTTSDQLNEYFHVWAKMFLKHPGCYLSSFIHNYYQYYWPGDTHLDWRSFAFSEIQFNTLNPVTAPIGIEFTYPKALDEFRTGYESLRESIARNSIFGIFDTPTFYTWFFVILLAYSIYKRNRDSLLLQMYPLGILLMCNLSPCNGYFCRYEYPIIMALPALMLFTLKLTRDKQQVTGGKELG